MPEIATKSPAKNPPSAPTAIDQDALSVTDLAKAILAREIRPRVNAIRRLAEAALESDKKPAKKKKKSSARSKPSKKQRKLAKIPGQKQD